MLCSGDREKGDVAMEEKWDYVVSGRNGARHFDRMKGRLML